MKNYKDYIDTKFVPKEDFIFQQKDKEREYAGKQIIDSALTITHKKTKTYFEYLNAYGDWDTLYSVKFGNPKTKCTPNSSVFDEPIDIDDDILPYMNEFLAPAFNGWTVREYYLFGKYNRSYYCCNFGGRGRWEYSKFKLWDIFRIIDLLLYFRIIGKEKRIVIEGIKSS